ncbi:hypothetical protein C8Q72DRAFT_163725 [Fomitopsis betulina]|nr:hypothetical protein C8Q72DRAFT_163725 [Fomitopsis betulina]
MLGSSLSAFIVVLLSLCFSGFVNAAPVAQPDHVLMAPRQAATPTTVTTTDTIQTPTGPIVSGASTASAAGVTKTAVSNAAVTFTVPGRHILILPVGLVVFCVITGFMLLVIVYQHFWRMRYRSAFRQRKLSEQGAGMGYGGMGKA